MILVPMGSVLLQELLKLNNCIPFKIISQKKYIQNLSKFRNYISNPMNCNDFHEAIAINHQNWPSFNYEFVKLLRSSIAMNLFFNSNIAPLIDIIFDLSSSALHFEGFDLFINAHKIPGFHICHIENRIITLFRKNFINFWIPLFDNRSSYNSTLRVYPTSHTWHDEGFYEFQGSSIDSKITNAFIQYRAIFPQNAEGDYCDLNLNLSDIVFFHKDLIHSSTTNNSSKPAYALVGRVFDPSCDPTISSSMSHKPYQTK